MKYRCITVYLSLAPAVMFALLLETVVVYGSNNKKIEEEKRELESITRRIDTKRIQKLKTEKKEGSILSRIEELDYQLGDKEKLLRGIDHGLSKKDVEIEVLEGETERLKGDLAAGKKRVRERIRRMYKEGRLVSLKVFFSATDHIDLLKRYHYMEWLRKRDLEVIEGYEATLRDLEVRTNRLGQVRSEMWKAKNEVTGLMREIEGHRRQKEGLLTRVRLERSSYVKVISELEEEAMELQSLIKELEARKSKETASLGFANEKGRLYWPVSGKIVSSFGRQKHSRFDTYIYKKGVEIRSFNGDKIMAVYSGTVVYAGWFRGYGQLIILDHGDNYFSLYAHAERLLVTVGERVKKEQIIGEIGDTGLSNGNDLYFEIRHGANPIDPILWLKNRGQTVLLGEKDE
ncbi:MAG TPA: peptidoglycan DD-metalloendopeptidase family protein [Nitrospiria bacterium]|nr:peptidoglycan DD-metalloendopeptidase family protein [Nitrospiria bacterium]